MGWVAATDIDRLAGPAYYHLEIMFDGRAALLVLLYQRCPRSYDVSMRPYTLPVFSAFLSIP
jgi:hypothetical protein